MEQAPHSKDWHISRPHPPSHSSAGHNSLLLVSLDSRGPRASLVELLVSAGYTVCDGSGANAMLNVLNVRDFDVVVLDFDFTTVPPETLCFSIGHAIPSVCLIVLGPRVSPAVKARLLESGADDYIEKPFDRRELIARIDSTLRRAAPNCSRHN